MKRLLVLVLSALVLTGCNSINKKIKPVVLSGYVVVNNMIGYIRPFAQNQDMVIEKIDLLVDTAFTITKALQFLSTTTDNPVLDNAYVIAQQIHDILQDIKGNPESVIDKIALVIVKLEEVRNSFVAINETMKLGIVFPTPKVLTFEDELIASVEALKAELEAQYK